MQKREKKWIEEDKAGSHSISFDPYPSSQLLTEPPTPTQLLTEVTGIKHASTT